MYLLLFRIINLFYKKFERQQKYFLFSSGFTELPVRDNAMNGNSLSTDLPTDLMGSHSPTPPTTEDVLLAARNKLATSVAAYNTFRPLSADRDSDYSFEDDMDYKYDRHIRSYDNARNKAGRGSSFRSSYLSSYPHRI